MIVLQSSFFVCHMRHVGGRRERMSSSQAHGGEGRKGQGGRGEKVRKGGGREEREVVR